MKRFVTLLLAAVMALGLVACGGKTTPAASTPAASTPAASTPAASTPAASTPAAPAEPVKLTIGVNGKTNVTEWENNALTLWLEEVTGFDLSIQVFSTDAAERKAQLAAMVAAKEKLPDVMFYFALGDLADEYGRDGYFLDLAPYFDNKEYIAKLADKYGYNCLEDIENYCDQDQKDRIFTETRTYDGHQYSWVTMGSSYTDQPRNMLFINQNWLDKLGLAYPRTFDDLLTVLKAFVSKDPNGNGKADEMGMVGSVNVARGDIPSWLINRHIYLNDNYMFNCDDSGKIYLPYDQDAYREGLRDVRKLFKEGLIGELTWTITSSELQATFTPPDEVAKIGVWAGHPSLRVAQGNPVLYEYTGLMPLEGSYAAYEPLSISKLHYISADCENPDAAFELCYAWGSPEGCRRNRYGQEGVDWVWEKCPDDCPYCHGAGAYAGNGKSVGMSMKVLQDAYSGTTTSTFANAGFGVAAWVTDGHPERPCGYGHSVYEPKPENIEDWTWAQRRSKIGQDHAQGYLEIAYAAQPKNMVFNVIYNQEELDKLGDAKTDILNYAKEARAQFITGQLDIDSDKDWNEYVKTIHGLGWDNAIAATQSAYSRMKGWK